jgi:hypothetical protein
MVSIEEQHPNAEYRSSVTVFGLSFVVVIEQARGLGDHEAQEGLRVPRGRTYIGIGQADAVCWGLRAKAVGLGEGDNMESPIEKVGADSLFKRGKWAIRVVTLVKLSNAGCFNRMAAAVFEKQL